MGQVNAGTFGPRISDHEEKWGRWEATEITVYLGRLYDLEPTTDKRWGELIDRAEAVLIYKLGIAYNSSRVKNFKFWDEPILLLNHGGRPRLPECLCTITEFINTDDPDLKPFGPSGHRTSLPIPPTEPLVEEEEMRGRGHPGRRNRKRAKG